MTANTSQAPTLLRSQLSLPALVRILLEPVIIVGSLIMVAFLLGDPMGSHYLLFAIILFCLTFPGHTLKSSSLLQVTRKILLDWFFLLLCLLLLGYATQSLARFPPEVLLGWMVLTPILLVAAQRAAPRVLPWILAVEGVRRRAVIVGAGQLGQQLATRVEGAPYLGIQVVGFFDDRSPGRIPAVDEGKLLGALNDLPGFAARNRVDIVYITLPMAPHPRNLKLLDELRDTTLSIYFVPDIFLFDLIQGRVDNVNGMPVVAACESPFNGIDGVIKRTFDLVVASMILLLISPLLVAIAIGVKLTSPGPVLFKQRRYGLDGREILVYKFRTMNVLEDGGAVRQATRNDARVTPFGAFLRRSSLDELPQFVNVLQGRMSIVGPRPHAVAHNESYRKLIKGYMIRHKIKPGITGLAQVNGYRGETTELEQMERRIEFDLEYLRRWSLRLDVRIIFRTIWLIGADHAAY